MYNYLFNRYIDVDLYEIGGGDKLKEVEERRWDYEVGEGELISGLLIILFDLNYFLIVYYL